MGLLDTLKTELAKRAHEQATIDPAVFDDPVASQAKWAPLVPGGASFGTHRLVELDATKLELRKSVGLFLFGGVFLLVGAGALSATVIPWIATGHPDSWSPAAFGAIFLATGGWLVWPTAIVFDASLRQLALKRELVPFDAVHALQIIKERVSGNRSSYWSYELNLVFRDGERKNVLDHGDLPRLRSDAARLSAFMGCKLWDAA